MPTLFLSGTSLADRYLRQQSQYVFSLILEIAHHRLPNSVNISIPPLYSYEVRILVILASIVFWTQGCAVDTNWVPFSPSKTALTSEEFEIPEVLDARDILPPELLKSEHHTVMDEVIPFGYTNHFSITSPFGQFEAYGEDMLRIRVKEIQALSSIEDVDKFSAFASGAQHAVLSPVKFVTSLLVDPIETLIGVPKGVWRFMTRVQEMVVGERGELEEDESRELIGFSTVKRRIADSLGVDVYSSNRLLQRKLDRLSWSGYAGDTGVRLLTIPIVGPAGPVLTGTSLSSTMSHLLRDSAPEDLRRLNREKLENMEFDHALIDKFLSHNWYSPRHETFFVEALAEMKEVKGRGKFMEVALGAKFEEDVLFFERLAEMMAAYHQNIKPLSEIVIIQHRLVMGYTTDHNLVAMLPVSRLPWRKEVAEATELVKNWKSNEHPVQQIELWISGNVTPQATRQLTASGIKIHEQAMGEILFPSSKILADRVLASAPSVDTSVKE